MDTINSINMDEATEDSNGRSSHKRALIHSPQRYFPKSYECIVLFEDREKTRTIINRTIDLISVTSGLVRVANISEGHQIFYIEFEESPMSIEELIRMKASEGTHWPEDFLLHLFQDLCSALDSIYKYTAHCGVNSESVVVHNYKSATDYSLGFIYFAGFREPPVKNAANDIVELGYIFLSFAVLQPRLPRNYTLSDDFRQSLFREFEKLNYSVHFAVLLYRMIATAEIASMTELQNEFSVLYTREVPVHSLDPGSKDRVIRIINYYESQYNERVYCEFCLKNPAEITLPCHSLCIFCVERHILACDQAALESFSCPSKECSAFIPPSFLIATPWTSRAALELLTLTVLRAIVLKCPHCKSSCPDTYILDQQERPYLAKCVSCQSEFCTYCHRLYVYHSYIRHRCIEFNLNK